MQCLVYFAHWESTARSATGCHCQGCTSRVKIEQLEEDRTENTRFGCSLFSLVWHVVPDLALGNIVLLRNALTIDSQQLGKNDGLIFVLQWYSWAGLKALTGTLSLPHFPFLYYVGGVRVFMIPTFASVTLRPVFNNFCSTKSQRQSYLKLVITWAFNFDWNCSLREMSTLPVMWGYRKHKRQCWRVFWYSFHRALLQISQ